MEPHDLASLVSRLMSAIAVALVLAIIAMRVEKTVTMKPRELVSLVFGVVSAVSAAVGVTFLVMWALSEEGNVASLPELIAGIAAVVAAVLAHVGRRALRPPADEATTD